MASPDCVTHKILRFGYLDIIPWCAVCRESWNEEHEYMEELVRLRQEVEEPRKQIQDLQVSYD